MSGLLPVRLPGEDDTSLLNRLLQALATGATGLATSGSGSSGGGGTTIIYDEFGRPLITPEGSYSYSDPSQTQFTAPVQPNLVQIDTADLVDGAVTLAQTNIPTMVQANQAVIGSAVVLNLLAGTVEAVTADIDNLRVNNANIVSLNAGKLTAGTISTNGILVGSSKFELDGSNQRIRITDGTNTRVDLGKIGAGSTDYGIKIFDASGTLIFSSGATSSINGAFIAAASIGSASINDLAANKITAGTLAAGVIYANAIAASQVIAGTMTGFVIQTTNGVSQATTRLSGTNNRLESYDASGTLIAAVGQNSLGGAVYAAANSPLFAAGYFDNPVGTAVQVIQSSIAAASAAVFISANDTGLSSASSHASKPAVGGSNSSSGIGVTGTSSSGYGVKGVSSGATGVLGESTSSNGGDFKNVASSGGWGSIGVPNAFGGWAFYSQVGTYGPFTASHDALIPKSAVVEIGGIVVDERIVARDGLSDTVSAVSASRTANQPAALGVVTRRGALTERTAAMRALSDDEFEALQASYDLLTVNAVGEGQILVCGEGGNIERGDLIVASSRVGLGMRQADDFVRSYTIAKAREDVTFASPTATETIACIYLCG